ncbi:hypothetical protein R6Q57_026676 [Mikania cordata]
MGEIIFGLESCISISYLCASPLPFFVMTSATTILSFQSLTPTCISIPTTFGSNPHFPLSSKPLKTINFSQFSSWVSQKNKLLSPKAFQFVSKISDWSQQVTQESEAGEEESYSEPPEDAKIFVGNLPYDVDSEKLAQIFSSAGVVEISEVIYNRDTEQSRGFGFVTMSTVEEAEKAVETFNGYVKFIILSSRLEQAFSEHGKVIDARVIYDRETGRSRGFGFVTMASETEMNDAIAALDGQSLDGRAIRVNVAEERPKRSFF